MAIGGVSYDVFKKLFSLVSPIKEYGAAILGYKRYSYINAIKLRACRYSLELVDILPTQHSWATLVGSQFITHN